MNDFLQSLKFPRINRSLFHATIGSAVSGLLLTAANPNVDCAYLAWFALVPWLLCLDGASTSRLRAAFVSGVVFAVVYNVGLTYWVGVCALRILGPARTALGWSLLILSQALFFSIWAIGSEWLYRRGNRVSTLIGIPALWVVVVEWLRQLGPMGLTWGDLAYTQHSVLPVLQVTKITGTWGLSYLIVAANVAIADAVRHRRFTKSLALTATVVVAAFVWGTSTMRGAALHPRLTAAILQADIDPNVEHDRGYVTHVMQTFSGLTDEAAARGATLTVWPEMAYPGYIPFNPGLRDMLTAQAVRRKVDMVIAGPDYNWARRRNLNSLFLITDKGIVAGSYHKRHLVPFGEYVPAADHIPAMNAFHVTKANMLTGASVQTLMPAGQFGNIGSAICFESSFPELMREQTERGANLLVVTTDDSWFDKTSEIRQHAAMSAVRAVENDRYVLRAATTGVSQVIDPTGRVVGEGPIDEEAVIVAQVEPRATVTPYVRWGDWFVAVCGTLLIAIAAVEARRIRSKDLRSK